MRRSVSVGIDLVEVGRMAKLTRNARFLSRVFAEGEIAYCKARRHAAQHFAVRFAAKEAIWKALNELEGARRSLRNASHKDIRIRNASSGKPEVNLSGPLSSWQGRVAVSLSHTKSQAVAVALVHLS